MSNCTIPDSVNATTLSSLSSLSSFEDLSSLIQVFLPFAAFLNLPDWLKLAIIGTVLETARRYLFTAWYNIKDSFFLSVQFDGDDSSFDWMMAWMSRQPAFQRTRDIEVSTSGVGNSGQLVPGEEPDAADEEAKPLKYVPSPHAVYSLWYKGRWMQVQRTQSETSGDYWRSKPKEKLLVSILTRDRTIINSLLLDAKKAWKEEQETVVRVYINTFNDWNLVATRPKRPMDSIILDPVVKNLVLEDAKDFLNSKKWYAARGIPFRRGYLLHGPPGNGKTSLIHGLAGELGLDVYIVSLSRPGLDDTSLSTIISELPTRCIALMEDIDAAFRRGITRAPEAPKPPSDPESKENAPPPTAPGATPPGEATSSVTLSGLLNALDGIGAQEGRILFATTNRYTALDSALTRPGRMDLHIPILNSTPFQAQELFKAFFLSEDEQDDEEATVMEDALEDEKGDLIDLGPADVTISLPPTPSSSTSPSAPPSPTATAVALPSPTSPTFTGVSHRARAPKLSRHRCYKLARRFAEAIPEGEFSMASLQGYLMTYKIRPVEAVQDVRGWIETQRQEMARKAEKSSRTS